MRSLAFAAVLLAAAPAGADSYAGAVGGIMSPLGDSHSDKSGWSDQVGSGPKLGVRAGANGESGLGGMFSADWTPVNYNYQSNFTDVSAHRFRILAHLTFEKMVLPKLSVFGRAGGGIDIAHASATVTVGPFSGNASDTDVGWAFELGGGAYFHVGDVQIGGELAVPWGGHNHKAQNGQDITFNYTSTDIDILFGVRVISR
jgi:hypothetical protein